MSKQPHSLNASVSIRITVLKFALGFFIALILLRLFVISVGQHTYYSALAENQHSFYQKLTASRGDILVTDRYSPKPYPVATNSHKDLVYVVPQDIKDPQATAESLARILSLDQKEIYEKLTDQTRKYIRIKKMLTDQESKDISSSKLTGVFLDQENIRYYPEGEFLSQVLGYLGYKDGYDDKVGLYGIEKYLESELAGKTGEILTETDKHGNWITGSSRDFTPAVDGASLKLTIDRAIQFKAEQVLKDAVSKHGADSGSVIIADPKTGAVLAMANYPSFNPNEYNKVKSPAVFNNLSTIDLYEPGSTMKTITMAAGIDAGVVSPSTTYNDTGVTDIAGYKIKNSDGKAHGVVPMTYVLNESLNTGAIFVEQKIGNDKFVEYIKKFGFGKPTEIELPETTGNLNNLKGNIQINYFTTAFGQGISVTPLQMLQSYLPLANRGIMMQPYIIDSKILPNGQEVKTKPKEVSRVVSERTADLISGMLVDVVENGHGKKAGVKGYYIGGKTGTSQVAENGVYVQNDNIGSFLGYGPIENPKFVMLVTVRRPRDVNFAESTAAPAFGEIAKFILNYYDIAPTRK